MRVTERYGLSAHGGVSEARAVRDGGASIVLCAVAAGLLMSAAACAPVEPGQCESADVQRVYYDVGGYPAYAGQALVDTSCAGGVCHTSGIAPGQRYGVPAGLDFDVGIAVGDTPEATSAALERLRRARRLVWNWRASLWDAVHRDFMPPSGSDAALEWHDADGRALPGVRTSEGKALLRNWLACGAPVVEGVEGPGSGDVGDIVPREVAPVRCEAGLAPCGDACVDLGSDPSHCGACGGACGSAQLCDAGSCVCAAGLTACGASCVDLATDAIHCGACEQSCGALFCSGGACLDACPAGTMDCAGSCVDLATSAANCGSCGTVCSVGETCVGSACACTAGLLDCGGGCVDVTTSDANCGACGDICPAGATCAASACVCAGGLSLCGGACLDVSNDAANCGACGNACAAGQACTAGACATCGPSVTLSSLQAATFTPACASMGCHTGVRPAAGLSLAAGNSWAALVGRSSTAGACGARTLVVPGNASGSYLLDKLRGAAGICGSQMPKAGAALPAAQLTAIEAWICHGALND